MKAVVYIVAALLLVIVAFIVFRILVRRDYQQRGRLTLFTGFLELLVWGLYMSLPYLYNPPQWVLFWSCKAPVGKYVRVIGMVLTVIGLVSAFATMLWFGLRRAFGLQVEGLVQSGLYGVTRNPQLVTGSLMVIGTAMLWPSWYAAGWVVLYGVVGHLMVVTEEDHLREVYGEEYERYCEQIPRYVGLWRRR